MLLHVLGHVDAHHRVLVVEEELGERARRLRLADARGTEEDERPDRPIGILEARPRATHGVRDRGHCLILPDDALRELLVQLRETLPLALEHARDRDARPLRHDLGDVLGGDLLLEEARPSLAVGAREFLLGLLHLALQLGNAAVADLRGLLQVAAARRLLRFDLRLLDGLLDDAHGTECLLLALPLGLHAVRSFAQFGELLLDGLAAVHRALVFLFLQRGPLDLELHDAALDLVDLLRHRVDLDAEARRGLVEQVDGFVRQEAVADIAVRERRRGDDGVVRDADAVVRLVALLEPAQDGDRALDAGLAHVHGLEATLERGVLLHMKAILVERGGADDTQLSARQHRLEHVAGVHRALGLAGADERVELVDEDDEFAFRFRDLLEHRLQALLELAAILRARDHGAQIERDEALVLEPFGNVTVDDALSEPFDDRRLADARLADEHRIVFRAP